MVSRVIKIVFAVGVVTIDTYPLHTRNLSNLTYIYKSVVDIYFNIATDMFTLSIFILKKINNFFSWRLANCLVIRIIVYISALYFVL